MLPAEEARLVTAGQVVDDAARPDRIVEPSRSVDRVSLIMACIRAHESDTAGGYKAENPTSTASGAYQFIDGTWQAWADRSGVGTRWRHASDAPPVVQDRVARYAITHGGLSAWKGTGCPGT